MAGGAAPPMTPRQRAFLQSVHEARLERRKAALERHKTKLRGEAEARGLEEAARNRALAEATEAQERDLAERRTKEAADFAALQRAQQAHYEATRHRTLAELVEASMQDEA